MLKAREVWNEQEGRRLNRMAAMMPVMTQIQAKIKQQAVHNTNAPYIVYEVPTFVFGYPLYKLSEALEFLVKEYMTAGYWVWIVENKYLLISWIKPIKTRELGKPILATNYRPQVYDPSAIAFMARDTME
uniref:Uncharacterized protein n=1 Tax=viral metagenome TaxID=1070528 RepID=A0A6C0JNW4_9ZZZZ